VESSLNSGAIVRTASIIRSSCATLIRCRFRYCRLRGTSEIPLEVHAHNRVVGDQLLELADRTVLQRRIAVAGLVPLSVASQSSRSCWSLGSHPAWRRSSSSSARTDTTKS